MEMKMAKGQGVMEVNKFGGKRESNRGRGFWHLLPYEGLEELARWYEEGAIKYGPRNWEKGMSNEDSTNRMIRHSIKCGNGWMDEGPFAHYCAVAWNALAVITMIKRHPELNDHFHDEYLKALGLAPDWKPSKGTRAEMEEFADATIAGFKDGLNDPKQNPEFKGSLLEEIMQDLTNLENKFLSDQQAATTYRWDEPSNALRIFTVQNNRDVVYVVPRATVFNTNLHNCLTAINEAPSTEDSNLAFKLMLEELEQLYKKQEAIKKCMVNVHPPMVELDLPRRKATSFWQSLGRLFKS